jgi:hypothetical protein
MKLRAVQDVEGLSQIALPESARTSRVTRWFL